MAVKSTKGKLYRRGSGSSLIETVMGSILIVMIALFLVDVAAVVVCQTQNDALAKHIARSAANQVNYATGDSARLDVVNEFKANNKSNICTYKTSTLGADAGWTQVVARSEVFCVFPVPIPFGPSQMVFAAEATEPVVGTVPPAP